MLETLINIFNFKSVLIGVLILLPLERLLQGSSRWFR